ncbi:hypothetical protein CW745_08205 [Psychromonas sp. psych-6C06]|uniref:DUF2298 domain-containing protein n=1 Tax=Psychromonas sp. psych-6C06 TaxID=2058089 RepID=UPI000C342E42|nr:DUF2298 domain-containing protein [Psychromonas sp. psych-6C06]PKF61959.1 hypothetical protein CW745_08205 [Psychromonas sp. psych-6C06]
MHLIFLFLMVLIITINFSAIALFATRWVSHYALAKISGLLLLCLTLFFIEHFIGLGNLNWLWPISTCFSLFYLAKNKTTLFKQHKTCELVFFIGLVYGLMWRLAFPDINGQSEDLTDLAFLSSYYPGHTLPAVDNWLPPYSFNFYYAFQHYCGALLGRWLALPIGMTYNVAFAVLLAFLVSMVWSIASLATSKYLPRVLLVVAVVMGGSGISAFVPFMYQANAKDAGGQSYESLSRLWSSVRFIGMYDKNVSTDFGKSLVGIESTEKAPQNPDLPIETIGYLTMQGDFHPPLGGFLLVLIAICAILLIEQPRAYPINPNAPPTKGAYQAILVATGPLMWITNTWVLPLQSILVFAWIAYRCIRKLSVNWTAIILGGLIPLFLMLPFLNEFTRSALSLSIGLVSSELRTPFVSGLLLLWPQLLLLAIGAYLGRKQPIIWLFVVTFTLFLIASELFFVDDPMGGLYERFNTTLKWWSWLQVAVVVSLSTLFMASKNRIVRGVNLIVLFALASYALELAYYFNKTSKPSRGKLKGDYFLTKDQIKKQTLEYLISAPYGVVLEGIDNAAYGKTSSFALFSNKSSLVGWHSHESQWRGHPAFINQRGSDARAFYQGELENSLAWLQQNRVTYIVWSQEDSTRAKQQNTRQRIHSRIHLQYHWVAIQKYGYEEYGIWVLKDPKMQKNSTKG